LLSDGISFAEKKLILREATAQASQISVDYGLLMETVLDFLIVGFTIFLVVKFINRLIAKPEDVQGMTVPTPVDVELLSKTKDLLEEQNKVLSKK
jgi:large conductance mechanosensitive channel